MTTPIPRTGERHRAGGCTVRGDAVECGLVVRLPAVFCDAVLAVQ